MSKQTARQEASAGARQRSRWWATTLLAGGIALAAASGALASSSPAGILSAGTHDIYYRGEVLPDDGLAELRGGFRLAGLELNFGAKLTTAINDRVRYVTQVAFDNAGARILSRTLDQQQNGAFQVTPLGVGGINVRDIGGQLDLSGLSEFSGFLMNDAEGGMTAALHNITRNAIVSALATTASGQSISNNVDVSVEVMNIGEIRSAQQRSRILNSMQGIMPR